MNIIHNDIFQFILYFATFLLFYYIIEKSARKRLQIEKRSEAQEVNDFHKWGKKILWAIFFVSVVFFSSPVENALIIMFIFSFDAYMQWRADEKEYMMTLLELTTFMTFIVIGYSFDLMI
ncbi:DUF4181 domain-containing protein [Rossellomorea aquimaris]|uniref:DUF4181 domain-containing protein n=1 Tax=Rossellomorea aquimaris TaxID=189382 RepID=UPI001CFD41C9|nr:DUF4181 domain-containing protein [Rossellomorea aquimaris]